MSASASGFYCTTCDVHFSDSYAAEAHRASLKHKKKSGELDMEKRLYRNDGDVTPDDVWSLISRKQVELGLVSWREIRCTEADITQPLEDPK